MGKPGRKEGDNRRCPYTREPKVKDQPLVTCRRPIQSTRDRYCPEHEAEAHRYDPITPRKREVER